MNILIVSPDQPYPANHGARADIWSRIKCLSELGFNLDLLVTGPTIKNPEHLAEIKKHVKSISFFERNKNILYFLKLIPYQVSSRSKLSQFSSDKNYDLIILESESVASVLNSKSLSYRTLALRVHNNESKYFKALANSSNNIFIKLHYIIESFFYSSFSEKLKSRVNLEMHISKEEHQIAASNPSTSRKITFLPSHFETSEIKKPFLRKNSNVLFVGNLFTANNLAGLFWYLDNVHDLVSKKIQSYRLIIAGNTKGSNLRQQLEKYPSLEFHDSPSDLDEYYATASAFINPMLEGAGVKLKTLNAISEGIPLVSTSVGSEGIGLEHKKHYLLADEPVDFGSAVIDLLIAPEKSLLMAAEAQSYLTKNFNAQKALSALMGDIEKKLK